MDDSATTGALTEIALALAMAFFCILVLTLVSMGTPTGDPPAAEPSAGPAAPRLLAERPGREARPLAAGERLVLFRAGRFLDRDGAAVDPARLSDAPVVLAVDPALPLDRVLAARARFAAPVTVTALDPAWLEHLSTGGAR